MIFTMRFYRHCDLDLISLLWSIKPRQRTTVVKRSIDAYLGLNHFQIEDIPLSASFNDVSLMNEVYSLTIRVTDKEEIFINQLRNGFKNNALKNIVRQYIGLYGLASYATDIDAFCYMNSLNIEKTIAHVKNSHVENELSNVKEQTDDKKVEIVAKEESNKKTKTTVKKKKATDKEEKIKEKSNNNEISDQEADALNNDIFELIGGML